MTTAVGCSDGQCSMDCELSKLFTARGFCEDVTRVTDLDADEAHTVFIGLMLDNGVDPNKRDADGGTALHESCELSNVESVRLLLEHGADPNAVHGVRKISPIHLAYNKPEILELLLDYGADVNRKDDSGRTVLHHTVVFDNKKCFDILLERSDLDFGADTVDGLTALDVASLDYYLERLSDPRRYRPTVNMPVMDVKFNRIEDLRAYTVAELNSAPCPSRPTALQYACEKKNIAAAAMLLYLGADPNATSINDETPPLILVACTGCEYIVRMLLDDGRLDVNAADRVGRTALHHLVQRMNRAKDGGHAECLELLLKAGAACDRQDVLSKTPLDYATDDETRQIFRKYVNTRSPL